jgi:murein DD-endopeptidase MepM/ murein hydrolase activator NlpD
MSLTLLYRGKNVRFSMKLNKLHWLSALVLFSLISGLVIHLIFSSNAVPVKSEFSFNESQMTNNTNNSEMSALKLKLAEFQSQILRLNALGNHLANKAKVPKKEFDFSVLPSRGGPTIKVAEADSQSVEKILAEVSVLEEQLHYEEKQLNLLESITLGHHIEDTGYLSGRPIAKGWLSSYYGIRKDPFSGRAAMHKGIDFAGKEDSAVIATASGVISWADKRYGYGNLIEIEHGKGYKTRYGHNKKILVKVGDVVTKGQVIANMGSTGRSTGPHVHYEILRNNAQINPIKYVYRKAK